MTKKNDDEDPKTPGSLIDENLKRIYDDVAKEEIPDRFKDLLSQLKQQDNGASGSK